MEHTIFEAFQAASPVGKFAWLVLVVMSIYSLAVMFDRWRAYRRARSESLTFLPEFVKCLKENRLDDAVTVTRKYKHSHLAKVVVAGLLEYQNDEKEIKDSHDLVAAVGRSLERSVALTSAEMKKGLSGLATIGSAAAFVGLFGTVLGIIAAFGTISTAGAGNISAVSGAIAEALYATALGIGVAVPAIMAYNYFTTRHERFIIEMTNSSAELMDFFLKKHEASHAGR